MRENVTCTYITKMAPLPRHLLVQIPKSAFIIICQGHFSGFLVFQLDAIKIQHEFVGFEEPPWEALISLHLLEKQKMH